MKKTLLLFVLFISNYVVAQDYTPMLADVNEWHLSTCFQGTCLTDKYFTDGDTLVNNMSYKILDGYHYISRSFMLREEVENKEVYLLTIINNTQREHLLYDFSLKVGDVFEMINPFTPFPEEGGEFELMSIELLELEDGNAYKHYYFSPTASNTTSTWDAIWVEGLGSLAIPNAPGGDPDFDGAGRVSCSFRDGNLFYSDYTIVTECNASILSADAFIVSTPMVLQFDSNISIINMEDYTGLTIFSITGQKIESHSFFDEEEIQLNASAWNNGIYLLEIKGVTGNTIIKKVVIR